MCRLSGLSDPEVLALAARDGRALVTHDKSTMPTHFRRFHPRRDESRRDRRAAGPRSQGSRRRLGFDLGRQCPRRYVFCEGTLGAIVPVVELRGNRRLLGGVAYSSSLRSRKALAMTETELKVMAALAIIGLSSSPVAG